jgi:hypothetical protein
VSVVEELALELLELVSVVEGLARVLVQVEEAPGQALEEVEERTPEPEEAEERTPEPEEVEEVEESRSLKMEEQLEEYTFSVQVGYTFSVQEGYTSSVQEEYTSSAQEVQQEECKTSAQEVQQEECKTSAQEVQQGECKTSVQEVREEVVHIQCSLQVVADCCR